MPKLRFLKDTLVGRTTYTPDSGPVDLGDASVARKLIARGLAVAAEATPLDAPDKPLSASPAEPALPAPKPSAS